MEIRVFLHLYQMQEENVPLHLSRLLRPTKMLSRTQQIFGCVCEGSHPCSKRGNQYICILGGSKFALWLCKFNTGELSCWSRSHSQKQRCVRLTLQTDSKPASWVLCASHSALPTSNTGRQFSFACIQQKKRFPSIETKQTWLASTFFRKRKYPVWYF